METINSLQAEYFKVADICTNLRNSGCKQTELLPLWYYQASLLERMDALSKKA